MFSSIKKDFILSMFERGRASLAANRCLFPKPKVLHKPVADFCFEFINMGPDDFFTAERGELYGDGSCLEPSHTPLARAGFPLAQFDHSCEVVKAVLGLMPRHLPQTSECSEFAVLSAAYDLSSGVDLVIDCEVVVKNW